MIRRYLARWKMRWAVREVVRIREIRARILVEVVRAARKSRHLEGRWGA